MEVEIGFLYMGCGRGQVSEWVSESGSAFRSGFKVGVRFLEWGWVKFRDLNLTRSWNLMLDLDLKLKTKPPFWTRTQLPKPNLDPHLEILSHFRNPTLSPISKPNLDLRPKSQSWPLLPSWYSTPSYVPCANPDPETKPWPLSRNLTPVLKG